MSKATKRNITNSDDQLIKLGREIIGLRSAQLEAAGQIADCEDALKAAESRWQSICDKIDLGFEKILTLTPVTPEGRQMLAAAIGAKCAGMPEFGQAESDFERGAVALFRAHGVEPLHV